MVEESASGIAVPVPIHADTRVDFDDLSPKEVQTESQKQLLLAFLVDFNLLWIRMGLCVDF